MSKSMIEFASKQEERLARLLSNAHSISTEAACFEDATYAKQLRVEANYLIANGVTIPVRCKDCHWWRHINKKNGCGICSNEVFYIDDPTTAPVTEPYDFCSYGERRTNGICKED